MYDLMQLEGRRILIVGASQGIGAQIALTLSKLGACLGLMARNMDKLKNVLEGLSGENHYICSVDVNYLDQLESIVKDTVQRYGMLDGMVYCAGITDDRPLAMDKPSIVENVLRTNLQGFIEMVRCVTQKGCFNAGMRIVGISSVSSLRGTKAHAIYSASKAGMDGAVRSMAVELAEKGICINTIAPGFIKTPMVSQMRGGVISERLSRQYLGIGMPEDVANVVAFLISPAARLITGSCIPVDGGILTH